MKKLLEDVKRTAEQAWKWFKGLPIVKPLYLMLHSRKTVISAAIVYFLLEHVPTLAPVKSEIEVLVIQVVGIMLIAIAHILGIATEDAAAKSAAGSPPAHLAG